LSLLSNQNALLTTYMARHTHLLPTKVQSQEED